MITTSFIVDKLWKQQSAFLFNTKHICEFKIIEISAILSGSYTCSKAVL